MASWGQMLTAAVPEAVATIAPLEKEWDEAKLEKKLKEYFYKASKQLEFSRRGLADMINEYADNAMGSIFAGLGDRDWLYTGQADLLLLLDAGVKDTFPAHLFKGVGLLEFEQLVLAAYDRAFDEQRFCPILSEAVPAMVSGPKIKKKVWNAIDQGRKDAVMASAADADEFTTLWINGAIARLSESSQGHPEATMEPDLAIKLFQMLLEGNALPLNLTESAASPLALVPEAVLAGYAEHTKPEEPAVAEPAVVEEGQPPAKKQKAEE